MIGKKAKNQTRQAVHSRIRKKVLGTAERPRLNVYRSVNHIYAQLIDDAKGVTLAAASSLEAGKIDGKKHVAGGNVASAKQVGTVIAERAKTKNIVQVVFDRGGYLYHGRVKALAEAARAAGLKF
ncbi:MAG TPA: 50S ribosomal protein L18 [Clostridia bacterium]|nr:50S ribosomal protein L18 [Clostridia bacterium]